MSETSIEPVATEFIKVKPLIDPRQDYRFHDPRSVYVERFWMSVLGPSAIWFLRLIVRELEAVANKADGVVLELPCLARRLGLGFKGGKNSALMRTIDRCCTFSMAKRDGEDQLSVRTALPPLPHHLHNRLPEILREEVVMWSRTHDACDVTDDTARALARELLDMGHGLHEAAERLVMLNAGVETSQRAIAWSWADSVSVQQQS